MFTFTCVRNEQANDEPVQYLPCPMWGIKILFLEPFPMHKMSLSVFISVRDCVAQPEAICKTPRHALYSFYVGNEGSSNDLPDASLGKYCRFSPVFLRGKTVHLQCYRVAPMSSHFVCRSHWGLFENWFGLDFACLEGFIGRFGISALFFSHWYIDRWSIDRFRRPFQNIVHVVEKAFFLLISRY